MHTDTDTTPETPAAPRPLTIHEERARRFALWLERWKVSAALPTSPRLMASVNRPHQKRGVPQPSHNLAAQYPPKQGKRVFPLWSYTPDKRKRHAEKDDVPYIVILRKQKALGQQKKRAA